MTRILKPLAKDPEESIRVALVRNQNTPAAILGMMVSDESQEVQNSLRWRSGWSVFPRDVLILGACKKKNVLALRKHGSITLNSEAIEYYTGSANDYIRGMAARNCLCKVKNLKWLILDRCDFVRLNVASNPNSTESILLTLAQDVCEEVREKAKSQLKYRAKRKGKSIR